MEIIFILGIFLVVIGSFVWQSSRSEAVLQNWASQNGYRILEAKSAYLFRGPFFWTTSKGQTVYRVRVQDSSGVTRNGWVRCGSWFWGLMSDQAEVRWDD